eukprot:4582866-Pyramimonas_sp.AAC.1
MEKMFRPAMPPSMVLLRSMFQVGIDGGFSQPDPIGICFVCARGGGAGDSDSVLGPVRTCPVCLQGAHLSCVAECAITFAEADADASPGDRDAIGQFVKSVQRISPHASACDLCARLCPRP